VKNTERQEKGIRVFQTAHSQLCSLAGRSTAWPTGLSTPAAGLAFAPLAPFKSESEGTSGLGANAGSQTQRTGNRSTPFPVGYRSEYRVCLVRVAASCEPDREGQLNRKETNDEKYVPWCSSLWFCRELLPDHISVVADCSVDHCIQTTYFSRLVSRMRCDCVISLGPIRLILAYDDCVVRNRRCIGCVVYLWRNVCSGVGS